MDNVVGHVPAERRKEQRFRVNGHAIAVLQTESDVFRLGRVVDVSRSGLAFDYLLEDGELPSPKLDDEVGDMILNILSEDGFMMLSGVPVRKINNRMLPRPDDVYITFPACRCGVHFDGLSFTQGVQLVNFLLQHAAHA